MFSFTEAGNRTNQDRAFVGKVEEGDRIVAAVFDGHGILGHDIAQKSMDTMLSIVTSRDFTDMFAQTQQAVATFLRGSGITTGGTTGTIVVVDGDTVTCAHLGDSPAYLFRKDGTHHLLTKGMHHAGNVTEFTAEHLATGVRFLYSGTDVATCHLPPATVLRKPDGTPSTYMVNHIRHLAMTRALGDLHFFAMNRTPTIHKMSVETDDRILVVSDGISDLFLQEESVHILPHVRPHLRTLDQIGEMLRTMTPEAFFKDCVQRAKIVYGTSMDDLSMCLVCT
jgi:serine/threonine protein phosphatase PrpC